MKKVQLSVVIPVYNRIELVNEMVQYIVKQSFQEWELLIIDDGSDDVTLKGLDYLSSIDKRIFIFRRPESERKGAPTCRNIGLKKANGEYVVFFDSDDIVSDFCFEQRVHFLKEHPKLDFAVFPFVEFEKDPSKPTVVGGAKFYKDDLYSFVNRRLPFMVWSNIYRTESLRKKGVIWDVNLKSLQDAHFNITSICAGLKYDYSSSSCADYYNRITAKGKSISKGIYSLDNFDSHIYYLQSLCAMIGRNGYQRALRHCFFYIYSIMIHNYSKAHSKKLIDVMSYQKWFYFSLCIKDWIYRNIFHSILSPGQSRWILFPLFSLSRKIVLARQRTFCLRTVKLAQLKIIQ